MEFLCSRCYQQMRKLRKAKWLGPACRPLPVCIFSGTQAWFAQALCHFFSFLSPPPVAGFKKNEVVGEWTLGEVQKQASLTPRENSWLVCWVFSLLVESGCWSWLHILSAQLNLLRCGKQPHRRLTPATEVQGPGLQMFLVQVARRNRNIYGCGKININLHGVCNNHRIIFW